MNTDQREALISTLKEMFDDDLKDVYNEYVLDEGDENVIYRMDDFNDVFCDDEAFEIARKCFFGDFNPRHNYFRFNGYGNIESFDYVYDEIEWEIDELAEYVYDHISLDELLGDTTG